MPQPAQRTPITADWLYAHPELDAELSRGELRALTPPGWRHGSQSVQLVAHLLALQTEHRAGRLFVDCGFVIARDPDTVRAPDLALVRRDRLPSTPPTDGFWPSAPDLAIEILSPANRPGKVAEKLHEYLEAGTRVVWILDPDDRRLDVFRAARGPWQPDERLQSGDALVTLPEFAPGWSVPLHRLFDDVIG